MTDDLRTYIDILEYYSNSNVVPLMEQEEVIEENVSDILMEKLEDTIFKLRSYQDDTGGIYSEGFERGLEMAAELLENIINNMDNKSGS